MKTPTKKTINFTHGGISALAEKLLGPLSMRELSVAGQFNISLLYESLPANSSAPDVTHARTKELVFIVSGKATGFLGGEKILLNKGDYLVIPAGTQHRFETGAEGVEALSIFSPPIDPANPDAVVVRGPKAA